MAPPAVRRLFFFLCLGIFVVGRAASASEERESVGRLDFGIPAQSLASALDAYSQMTGREIFYDGALVLGSRSAAVEGAYLPDAALRIMLLGTDFASRATGAHSFTIIRSPQAVSPAVAGLTGPIVAPGGSGGYQQYFAAVQAGLRQAFCPDPQTRPGDYQLVIRFWTSPSGEVLRSELLGSTGSRERDRAFSAALRTLRIGVPPPAAMPQPVTMAIFPASFRDPEECSAFVDDRVDP